MAFFSNWPADARLMVRLAQDFCLSPDTVGTISITSSSSRKTPLELTLVAVRNGLPRPECQVE